MQLAAVPRKAEFVSLSGALFGEAIPFLQVVQVVFSKKLSLRCFEDNQAVLAILAKGCSQKLRHLSKFHRINVASTCQAFEEPDIGQNTSTLSFNVPIL